MAEQYKYIAVTNWDKYQSGGAGTHWVKDYVDKEADLGYSRLTGFQRYVFDGLCRLRGRFGRNIDNDPTYIGRALQLLPEERKHIPKAIRTLLSVNTFCPSCGDRVAWLCDPCDRVVKWLCRGCATPVPGLCGLLTLSNQRDEIQEEKRIEENREEKIRYRKKKPTTTNDSSKPKASPASIGEGDDDDNQPA